MSPPGVWIYGGKQEYSWKNPLYNCAQQMESFEFKGHCKNEKHLSVIYVFIYLFWFHAIFNTLNKNSGHYIVTHHLWRSVM